MSASVEGNTRQRTALDRLGFIFPVGFYAIGAVTFFRWQFLSRFDLVFGDRGDARFVAFIHEHVFRWLQGRSELLSPPFFFNLKDTLGYSDAFLLDQVIYAPLRLLGADPLLALSLVALILSPVAFFFLYLFLRRLDISMPLAALGALLFTFPNNLYLKSNHLQHFAVYYIPVIAYCALLAITELHQRPPRACLLGAFAAVLYGLLFSTGYYMAWFFGLALLIAAPIGVWIAWPAVRTWWNNGPSRVLGLGAVTSLSFFATLPIFLVIYAPVLALGFKRSFADYLTYAPTPIDIVNVGMQNLVWSGLIRSLHMIHDDRLSFGEVSIALTPVVQGLVWASGLLALRPHFWPTDDVGRIRRALVIAGAGVCVLFYVLIVKTHNHSLFHVLYAAVPGADAIRAGYRDMVVANLFAVTAITLTCDQVLQAARRQQRALMRFGGLIAMTALLSVAAIEQVNLIRPTNLSRTFERKHLAALGEAPRACRSFYAAPEVGYAHFEVQIDAMMAALALHIPTINGYSGVFPPGWNFFDTNAKDYERRAQDWAARRGIDQGLCRLDIGTGRWTIPDRTLANIARWFRPPPGWIDMTTMSSQTGTVAHGLASARSPADHPGALLYGPYISLPTGSYDLHVSFACADNRAANDMDVTADNGQRTIAAVRLRPGDPQCDGSAHEVDLPFRLRSPAEQVEFRAFFGGSGSLNIFSLFIRSDGDHAPTTMDPGMKGKDLRTRDRAR